MCQDQNRVVKQQRTTTTTKNNPTTTVAGAGATSTLNLMLRYNAIHTSPLTFIHQAKETMLIDPAQVLALHHFMWTAQQHVVGFVLKLLSWWISSIVALSSSCLFSSKGGNKEEQVVEPSIKTEELQRGNDEEEEEEDDDDTFFKSCYPYEEIQSLQNRLSLSCAHPTTIPNSSVDNPQSHQFLKRRNNDVDCDIRIQNLELIGIFPTSRWLQDPTMNPDVKEMFGGTPFFPLGEYRVAKIDLADSNEQGRTTTTTKELIIIVNTGVEGMETGYWGACFDRNDPHECYAKLKASTAKVLVPKKERERLNQQPQCNSDEENEVSTTVVEQLLGNAIEFLVNLDWKTTSLPSQMIEPCDVSPRLERRRRAQQLEHRRRQLFSSTAAQTPTNNAGIAAMKVRSSHSTSKRFLFA